MSVKVTYELYEVGRDWPDVLVASVTAEPDQALAEITHYAFVYGQDGPVYVRLKSAANQKGQDHE